MKIRNGFVSNSSSSSFIIAVPRNVLELTSFHRYLFGDKTVFLNPYGTITNTGWGTSVISQIVWRDMWNADGGGCQLRDALVEEYTHGWTDQREDAERQVCEEVGIKNWYDINGYDERAKFYDRVEEVVYELSGKFIDDWMAKHPDHDFFIVEYSDNDGELFSAMEHGDTFDNIPHIRISKH